MGAASEAQASGLRVLASDAVPTECVVDPALVRFLPLTAGASAWAETLLEVINLSKPDQISSNARVEASRFSIATSARDLLEIYGAFLASK